MSDRRRAAIGLFSKPGHAIGEVGQLVREAATRAGTPIESGVQHCVYLDQAGVTVVPLNEHGHYLKELLHAAEGWREESMSAV